jgi:hypothetical protein
MLCTLDALPVGQRVPVRADRLGDPARGQGRGGVLFPCRQRVDVVGAADEFAACHRLLQDGGGVLGPARVHQGPAEADLGRDRVRVVGAEQVGPAVEDPLEHRDGLIRQPGRHQRLTQVIAHRH